MSPSAELVRLKDLVKNVKNNPFQNYVHFRSLVDFKFLVMAVLVAPVRCFMVFFAFAVANLLAIVLVLCPHGGAFPFVGWRSKLRDVISKLVIIAHVFAGFHDIEVIGSPADSKQAPIMVLAPHTSYLDILPFCLSGAPSPVGKREVTENYIFGKLLWLTYPILFCREKKLARKATIDAIQERVDVIRRQGHPVKWPPVAIFPEGTCTNRTALLDFKPGAFIPGVPIQPVCIHWKQREDKPDYYSWAWEGTELLQLFYTLCCTTSNGIIVEYLPVYYPSKQERKDPFLYARNLSSLMGRRLGLPVSQFTLDDAPFVVRSSAARRNKLAYLRDSLKLNFLESMGLEACLARARKLAPNRSRNSAGTDSAGLYSVKIDEFIDFLGLAGPSAELNSSSGSVQRLFNMFDWQCKRSIDLREFAVCFYAPQCPNEKVELVQDVLEHFSGIEKTDYASFVKIARWLCEKSIMELECDFYNVFGGEISSGQMSEYLKQHARSGSV